MHAKTQGASASFIYAQGLRLALYKGLHALSTKLVQKGGLPGGPASRALWVKLAKMLDVPGITHRNGILGLQADSARPGDSYYPIRAFPLRRQLVRIPGRLNAPENKVAFLKASGTDLAAMVATQGLLVACCSHSRPKTIFLTEHCVVLAQLLLLKLIISEHSRRPVYEFRGENCFYPVYQGKGRLAGGSIWRRPDRPKNHRQFINPAP